MKAVCSNCSRRGATEVVTTSDGVEYRCSWCLPRPNVAPTRDWRVLVRNGSAAAALVGIVALTGVSWLQRGGSSPFGPPGGVADLFGGGLPHAIHRVALDLRRDEQGPASGAQRSRVAAPGANVTAPLLRGPARRGHGKGAPPRGPGSPSAPAPGGGAPRPGSTPQPSPSQTAPPTPTPQPTLTTTPTPSPSPTPTGTPTPIPTPTVIPTPTPTSTGTPSPTASASPQPTPSPTFP